MLNQIVLNRKEVVAGSIGDIAHRNDTDLATAFYTGCKAVVLYDDSGSMAANDATDGQSRERVAINELKRLQGQYEGAVALIEFSSFAQFRPNGVPSGQHGGTNLCEGLKFIKPVDGCGLKIILVSDGEPNNPAEAIKIAKTFKNKIDTIYIGPESDWAGGRKFLRKLASATGGQFTSSKEVGLLADPVIRLLTAG